MAHNPSLFFLGFARISLRALTFEHPLAQRLQRRQAVEKNVARLTEIFKQTSCDRGKEKNAIIAVFSPHNLTRTLPKTIDSTIECAIEVPFLPVPSVDCLHGLHRVLAARKIFDEEDDWWLVRLYSFNIPDDAAKQLVEEYSYELPESDGEIFRNIVINRHCDIIKNKWLSYLTPAKQKNAKQFVDDGLFNDSLDELTEMVGLFASLKLGEFHRLFNTRCGDEIVKAFTKVGNVWNDQIFKGIEQQYRRYVGAESVEFLEFLAPAASREDFELISNAKDLFPGLNSSVQSQLRQNILKVKCMIPSLRSVFEDLKHIEPACAIMKELAGVHQSRTIKQCLMDKWKKPADPIIELGRSCYSSASWDSREDMKLFLYTQLWVYCLRNFAYLSPLTPRKDPRKPKPQVRLPNQALKCLLGLLAMRSGFRTAAARKWSAQGCEIAMVGQFKEDLEVGLGNIDIDTINRLEEVFRMAHQTRGEVPNISLFSPVPNIRKERRSGRAFDQDFQNGLTEYFLWPLINSQTSDGFINISFARRNLILSLFDDTSDQPKLLRCGVLEGNALSHIQSTNPNHSERPSIGRTGLLDHLARMTQEKNEAILVSIEKDKVIQRLQYENGEIALQIQHLESSMEGVEELEPHPTDFEISDAENIIAQLRITGHEANIEIERLKSEMDRLIAGNAKEKENFEETSTRLRVTSSKERDAVNQANDIIQKLELEIKELRIQRQEKTNDNEEEAVNSKRHLEEAAETKQLLHKTQRDIQQLTASHTEDITNTKASLSLSKSDIRRLNKELKTEREELERLRIENQNDKEEIQRLNGEIDKEKTLGTGYEAKGQVYIREKKGIQQQLETLKREKQQLEKTVYDQMGQENSAIQTNIPRIMRNPDDISHDNPVFYVHFMFDKFSGIMHTFHFNRNQMDKTIPQLWQCIEEYWSEDPSNSQSINYNSENAVDRTPTFWSDKYAQIVPENALWLAEATKGMSSMYVIRSPDAWRNKFFNKRMGQPMVRQLLGRPQKQSRRTVVDRPAESVLPFEVALGGAFDFRVPSNNN